mgnify:CR=1 FL=1|jgi:hypothetical protein|tara:strand:+ start:4770 stop:5024 length:255 start_codon:yes stop_codon:yes gene_type:complete
MFSEGDDVYIKKYMGNSLEPDKNKIYKIEHIFSFCHSGHGTLFEKKAIFNNGRVQLIYTYDMFTKERIFYVDKIPYYKTWFCCI